ncbi:MAG TPA: hypothetical protein VI408_01745 [Gaiellaceae bacterium]
MSATLHYDLAASTPLDLHDAILAALEALDTEEIDVLNIAIKTPDATISVGLNDGITFISSTEPKRASTRHAIQRVVDSVGAAC